MQKQPVVSVFMLAYNHEKFIKQALESVLMQKVNFDYEVVVGEDSSRDNTRNILLEFSNKYSEKFNLLLHQQNIGAHKNQELTYFSCKGKYIAMLEGDDYWTDPFKLQKQVDFLEANPDYNICYHDVQVIHEDGTNLPYLGSQNMAEACSISDLAKRNLIHTPSCMFRNGIVTRFPNWFQKSPVGDWPLFLLLAEKGKIKYLPDVMAVYRIHKGGTWGMRNRINQLENWIKLINYCDQHFRHRYRAAFYEQLIPYLWELVQLCREEYPGKAIRYGLRLLPLLRYQPVVASGELLRFLFKPYYIRFQRLYAPFGRLLPRSTSRRNSTHV